MKINVSYDEKSIKRLIIQDLYNKLGSSIAEENLKILVQSTQNYRVKEWETGLLKCDLEVEI